jgi:hypothetical protein
MGVDGVVLTQACLLLRQRRPVEKRRVRSLELGGSVGRLPAARLSLRDSVNRYGREKGAVPSDWSFLPNETPVDRNTETPVGRNTGIAGAWAGW